MMKPNLTITTAFLLAFAALNTASVALARDHGNILRSHEGHVSGADSLRDIAENAAGGHHDDDGVDDNPGHDGADDNPEHDGADDHSGRDGTSHSGPGRGGADDGASHDGSGSHSHGGSSGSHGGRGSSH